MLLGKAPLDCWEVLLGTVEIPFCVLPLFGTFWICLLDWFGRFGIYLFLIKDCTIFPYPVLWPSAFGYTPCSNAHTLALASDFWHPCSSKDHRSQTDGLLRHYWKSSWLCGSRQKIDAPRSDKKIRLRPFIYDLINSGVLILECSFGCLLN